MTCIHSYLTFNGNCREAMTFYNQCLGGELSLQTVGDSPMAGKLPQQMKNSILHATLTNGNLVLMGSDMANNELLRGNSVSLMLNCSSEQEIIKCYNSLSEGGEMTNPLEDTFWGAVFGNLTDKFGNHWILHFQKNNH